MNTKEFEAELRKHKLTLKQIWANSTKEQKTALTIALGVAGFIGWLLG